MAAPAALLSTGPWKASTRTLVFLFLLPLFLEAVLGTVEMGFIHLAGLRGPIWLPVVALLWFGMPFS